MTRINSFNFRLDFGGFFLSGYPIHKIEEGFNSVPRIDFTFSSSIIPIQIELKPNPDAANWEYAAARVASCNENFSSMLGGNFILTREGSIQNTKTTGALT